MGYFNIKSAKKCCFRNKLTKNKNYEKRYFMAYYYYYVIQANDGDTCCITCTVLYIRVVIQIKIVTLSNFRKFILHVTLFNVAEATKANRLARLIF